MKQLKQRLRDGLRQNPNLQIEQELLWTLPVQMIKVDYETVQQSKMDILMKMILTTIQQGVFTSIHGLVEVLLVEQLFVKHMIDKMEGAEVIERLDDQQYQLTEKGEVQLAEGLFTDQPETCSETLYYSPCHEAFIVDEEQVEFDQQIEAEYRHYDYFSSWEMNDFPHQEVEPLLEVESEADDSHIQTVISKIDEQSLVGMAFIPCIEFMIYDWEQELRYLKIWNTYENEWDEKLTELTMHFDRKDESSS